MKLNPKVAEQLPYEIEILWQASKKRKLTGNFASEVSRVVKSARQRFQQDQLCDRLSSKLSNYGNSGGWGLEQMKRLSLALFEHKRPANVELGKWVSVEIECVMPSEAAESSLISFIRKSGLKNAVTIKDDGSIKMRRCNCEEYYDEETDTHEIDHVEGCSIDPSTAYGREIIVTFKYGQWEILKSVCDKLNEVKCTVNKSCGLHVHFDMRHMENARKMAVVAQRVAKIVPALKQMLPASRQNNKFCNTIINRHSDSDRGEARYAFVNVKSYERHKTLEIRGHSGTTDALKIINWIRVIKTVMDKPSRVQISTVEQLISKFNFETDLVEYMLERQAKFKKVNHSADDVASDNVVRIETRVIENAQGEFVIYPVYLTGTVTNVTNENVA